MLFLPFPLLSNAEKKLLAVPYVLTGAGHQAVIIFFVLSGYLISGSLYRMISAGRWSWRKYLTHRLVRLWIVLLPALLLGLALDGIALYLHQAPALYSGQVKNALDTDLIGNFTTTRFFACLCFLQGIVIPGVFGSNSPLWSLANEFWYYVMFPLGLVALRPFLHFKARMASAALFLLIAFFVGRQILSLFAVWLLGSALAALRVPRFSGTLQIPTLLLYPFLFFFLAKFHRIPAKVSDYMLGVATYLFLLCLLQSDYVAPAARWVTLSRLGSRFHTHFTLFISPFSSS